jgi:hypothetical protein
MTLLATLLVVPGIAIFWNHLPKDIAHSTVPKPMALKTEAPQFASEDFGESATSVSMFVPESVSPSLPEMCPAPVIPPPVSKVASEVPVQQVLVQPARTAASPQDFESLELRLKALGAAYYRLEKWGNRGELFRFSCFVTPPEPYSYEKHFQAIGVDAVATMRSVIDEIETWKNARTDSMIRR